MKTLRAELCIYRLLNKADFSSNGLISNCLCLPFYCNEKKNYNVSPSKEGIFSLNIKGSIHVLFMINHGPWQAKAFYSAK